MLSVIHTEVVAADAEAAPITASCYLIDGHAVEYLPSIELVEYVYDHVTEVRSRVFCILGKYNLVEI